MTNPVTYCILAVHCGGDHNWKYFNDSCYHVSTDKVSWYRAREKCKELNAELTSLHGQDEVDAIVSYIKPETVNGIFGVEEWLNG